MNFTEKLHRLVEQWGLREIGAGLLLFAVTLFSMVTANTHFGPHYVEFWETPIYLGWGEGQFSLSLKAWINEGLMTLFFFVVGLEIKREFCIGSLSNKRVALLPIIAAAGGMLVPAFIYFVINSDDIVNLRGWGIPVATDIAFAVGVITLFKRKIPAVAITFLLTLATADDLGAIAIIAFFYTKTIQWHFLVLAVLACGAMFLFTKLKFYYLTPYFVTGGSLWFFLHEAGVNPDIAGVIVAFFIPLTARIRSDQYVAKLGVLIKEFMFHDKPGEEQRTPEQQTILREMKTAALNVHPPLQRMMEHWHFFSLFIVMPVFAMANMALPLQFAEVGEIFSKPLALGIIAGLVLGKPLGIIGFSYGFAWLKAIVIPTELTFSSILAVGTLGGIGFTMSLFIADLSFAGFSPDYLKVAKLGIVTASIISTLIATVIFIFKKKPGPQLKE